MKQKDREIIKKIFSQISNLTYSVLKSQFNKEYEEKLKIETKYSHDLTVEGRLEREEYITNLDASQLKSFKSVVKSIQDNYLFTEDDIDRLNNFTSRLNYLLKSTSPHNRGMADQMNNIKHGARINPNAPTFTLKSNSNDLTNDNSKNTELEIHKFFNDCIKSNTWKEFKKLNEARFPSLKETDVVRENKSFSCSIPAGPAYKYYRFTLLNLKKLPTWHPGKGTPGWIFVDELFLN